MVGAALTTGTAIALGDSTDDTFIAKMHNLGFTRPAGEDSGIIAVGHQICADRMAGKTPNAIAADLPNTVAAKGIMLRQRPLRGDFVADAMSMVSAAEMTYCPG